MVINNFFFFLYPFKNVKLIFLSVQKLLDLQTGHITLTFFSFAPELMNLSNGFADIQTSKWIQLNCLPTAARSLRALTLLLIWDDTNISTEGNVLTSVTWRWTVAAGDIAGGVGAIAKYMFCFCPYHLPDACTTVTYIFSVEATDTDLLRLWTSCSLRGKRLPGLLNVWTA